MSFGDGLYQLLIEPLQIIFEFIYYYAEVFSKNTGLAIIILSLALSFMLLPLFLRADAIQEKERLQVKKMEGWVKHIKKTFKGNEGFMILQTYYRQNNYKPYYSLRGLMPLMLEIPFFIAAYNFLSGYDGLKTSFGPISDLSAPDALISIGNITINLLPVLMTLINIISSAIYTKGLRLKDKLQLYAMALLFLVLLYNSPAGLVLYWTMNNLFSLVKNIIVRLPKPQLAGFISVALLGAGAVTWSFVMPAEGTSDRLPMLITGILLFLPLIVFLIRGKIRFPALHIGENAPDVRLFVCGCAVMTLLTGVLIPSATVAASPTEFVDYLNYEPPLSIIFSSFLLAAGLFLVWGGILYYLSDNKARWILETGILWLCVISIINYMTFGSSMGVISEELKYIFPPQFNLSESITNIIIMIAVALIAVVIKKVSISFVRLAYIACGIAIVILSGINVATIRSYDGEIQASVDSLYSFREDHPEDPPELMTLSKNKKNVVVLMLDRAINSTLPYIFKENPGLEKQFDGFTYYPNSLSHGKFTRFGTPGIFGGYEYTPDEMNKRSSEPLVDKHNEALLLMPVIFDSNNYNVTVLEPPLANHKTIPDLSIYDKYDGIKAYTIEQGQLRTKELSEYDTPLDKLWRRNFFWLSLMKISPCVLQAVVYHDGDYYSHFGSDNTDGYINSFAVMDALPSITKVSKTDKNTFTVMSNSMTHDIQRLQEPEYSLEKHYENTGYYENNKKLFTIDGRTIRLENENQIIHYQSNAAALKELGEWFDSLRKKGVYDNTRIIIVADHGANNLCQFDNTMIENNTEDILSYNPLLLVKDFGSKGFSTDNSFMTTADVPTLAFSGLINDPVNPFTGKKITNDAKKNEQPVLLSEKFGISDTSATKYEPSQWYSVHDDIFDLNNWKKLDIH